MIVRVDPHILYLSMGSVSDMDANCVWSDSPSVRLECMPTNPSRGTVVRGALDSPRRNRSSKLLTKPLSVHHSAPIPATHASQYPRATVTVSLASSPMFVMPLYNNQAVRASATVPDRRAKDTLRSSDAGRRRTKSKTRTVAPAVTRRTRY